MGEEMKASSCKESAEGEGGGKDEIYRYIFGFVEMAVVKCAIELNIAEAMERHKSHSACMTLAELTSAIECDASMVQRIMRFLTSRNIFKQVVEVAHDDDDEQVVVAYAQTPLSRLLIKESEESMAAFVLLESSPVMLAPWHHLSARVRANGTSSFERAHDGKDVWGYAQAHAEHGQLINEAMACDARRGMREILDHCLDVFHGLNSVVDVGGGNGTAMRLLATACPSLTCINFDLPHVVSVAPHSHALQHVAGDMFVSVPKADAAFLMWVLHDWGDEECIQILKNCREAVGDKGRLIIAEAVLQEEGSGSGSSAEKKKKKKKKKKNKLSDEVGLMLDMVMMAHTNIGKERTQREWEYVITQAGFTTFSVRPIPSSVKSLIIAFP